MVTEAEIAQVAHVRLPVRFSFKSGDRILEISCLESQSSMVEATVSAFRSRGQNIRRFTATTPDGFVFGLDFASTTTDFSSANPGAVLRGTNLSIDGNVLNCSDSRFLGTSSSLEEGTRLREIALASWRRGIHYVTELSANDVDPGRVGLRRPQMGALHAIAAHWSLSKESAIVVMPTGTGKTEVMLALSVESYGNRVLVVVPTDALRQQTADKFREYGLLRRLGVLVDVKNPVVGVLAGKPTTDQLPALGACNVVVTTMSSIARADDATQRQFGELFSEVFFDEAHHIQAQTWKRFLVHCAHARTILFTATPFREDGKALPGKIIYNFPLQSAQEQGFFRPIHFLQVFEPDSLLADFKIAEVAVARLREDLAAGLDHMLLARANTIEDAENLHRHVYQANYADLSPVAVHSHTPSRLNVLRNIRGGMHRIVICVDMFGEGFDLPNLKVAALHSVHKSLGITLQFIGRFARSAGNVGAASFVANTAEDGVPEALESLYQEDADWNALLSDLSYDAIDPQAKLSELIANLLPIGDEETEIEISALTLKPKMSTEVFRATDFNPLNFRTAFRPAQIVHQPHISREDRMLFFVVNQKDTIDWTDSKDIAIDSWDLFVALYDEERQLLFINSSRKKFAAKLANSISTMPVPIKNEEVFRAFGNVRRLILHSVGLTSLSRNVRYQMFAGLDVRDAIDPVLQQDKMKSNVMGVGYEDGRRVSVGCSRKGKIWSLTTGSLAEWQQWCQHLGLKLMNVDAAPDDFLRHTLVPSLLREGRLPDARALMVDWPDQLFESTTFRFVVTHGETRYDFHDCGLHLVEWNAGGGSFKFSLRAGQDSESVFRLTILAEPHEGLMYKVEHVDGPELSIDAFAKSTPSAEFFTNSPPLVRLEDGSQLSGEILLKPREQLGEVFERDAIGTIAWADTDISQESRWRDGAVRPRSIQQRFIEHLEQGPSLFIIDDDDNGESADVVAIEETEDTITVTLWHCKYASGNAPGNRVDDLYEVCGQAQKSIKWTWSLATLVTHLTERETKHRRGRDTRFVRGNLNKLVSLRKASRRKFVVFKVGIVQPGLLKAGILNEHLAILGATNMFLRTITNHQLLVIAS
jgi:superfamily II DNA or RNA helicase